MQASDLDFLKIGSRLTAIFVVLLLLILGGNGFLIWQFHLAQGQTDRLGSVNQQSIAVLELQQYLLLFHQQMDELARSRDANELIQETAALREKLVNQIERTRQSLARSTSSTSIDPAFFATLDGIEITLPSQLDAITNLAKTGDWEAVQLRLGNELRPVETLTSTLVNNIDQSVAQEHSQVALNMRDMQRRILLIVPATAVSTFLCAALFGWIMTRRMVELRLEERLNERTRIARELHDTLLQGIISVSMQLHVAEEKLPAQSPARPLFMRSLELIQQVIEDGRNALRGFRSVDAEPEDLERALSRIPQDIDAHGSAGFRLVVEGSSRVLRPLVRDEVYRIVREALANAFRHSQARTIEVVLEYAPRELRISVRDNGCGIDPTVLQRGRDGHWGLAGMRERAERIDAKLRLLSSVASGTEVELRVPGRIAFESANPQRTSKSVVGL